MNHGNILNNLTDETIKVLLDNNILKSDESTINTYTFIKNQLNKALDIGTNHLAPVTYYHHKKVNQLDKFGNIIDTYPSIKAAARALKIDSSTISKVLNSKRSTAGGYKWKLTN